MKQPPAFPPIYADEATMAYLLCMGESTFRSYVSRGLLPQGILIGSSRRWKVDDVVKALDRLGNAGPDENPASKALKDYINGKKAKGERDAA